VKKQGFVSFLAVTLSAVVLLSCKQQSPERQNTPAATESSALTQSLTVAWRPQSDYTLIIDRPRHARRLLIWLYRKDHSIHRGSN
jgi:hypothetical protein